MNKLITPIALVLGFILSSCSIFEPEEVYVYQTDTLYVTLLDTLYDTTYVDYDGSPFELAMTAYFEYDSAHGYRVRLFAKAIQREPGIYYDVWVHGRLYPTGGEDGPIYDDDNVLAEDSTMLYEEYPNIGGAGVVFKELGTVGYAWYTVGVNLDWNGSYYWTQWVSYKKS